MHIWLTLLMHLAYLQDASPLQKIRIQLTKLHMVYHFSVPILYYQINLSRCASFITSSRNMLPVDSDTGMSRDIRVKSLVMLTKMAKQFVMYCQMVPKLNIMTTPMHEQPILLRMPG